MGNYAHINNADNTVIAVVDWDGVSEKPLPEGTPIDSTLIPIEGTAVPAVGAVWNGTAFVPPAEEPPVEPPPLEEEPATDAPAATDSQEPLL